MLVLLSIFPAAATQKGTAGALPGKGYGNAFISRGSAVGTTGGAAVVLHAFLQ